MEDIEVNGLLLKSDDVSVRMYVDKTKELCKIYKTIDNLIQGENENSFEVEEVEEIIITTDETVNQVYKLNERIFDYLDNEYKLKDLIFKYLDNEYEDEIEDEDIYNVQEYDINISMSIFKEIIDLYAYKQLVINGTIFKENQKFLWIYLKDNEYYLEYYLFAEGNDMKALNEFNYDSPDFKDVILTTNEKAPLHLRINKHKLFYNGNVGNLNELLSINKGGEGIVLKSSQLETIVNECKYETDKINDKLGHLVIVPDNYFLLGKAGEVNVGDDVLVYSDKYYTHVYWKCVSTGAYLGLVNNDSEGIEYKHNSFVYKIFASTVNNKYINRPTINLDRLLGFLEPLGFSTTSKLNPFHFSVCYTVMETQSIESLSFIYYNLIENNDSVDINLNLPTVLIEIKNPETTISTELTINAEYNNIVSLNKRRDKEFIHSVVCSEGIEVLDVSGCINLVSIKLSSTCKQLIATSCNNLETIIIPDNSNLKNFNLTKSKIKELVFDTELSLIAINDNSYLKKVHFLKPCNVINVSDNTITDLVVAEGSVELNGCNNKLTHILIPDSIKKLELSNNELLTFKSGTNVEKLKVDNNNLMFIQLNDGLKSFNVNNNKLTKLFVPDTVSDFYAIDNDINELRAGQKTVSMYLDSKLTMTTMNRKVFNKLYTKPNGDINLKFFLGNK